MAMQGARLIKICPDICHCQYSLNLDPKRLIMYIPTYNPNKFAKVHFRRHLSDIGNFM